MTLPSSGTISMGDIRTELSASGTISLNDTNVRNLAGISSGTISLSNFYGKSAVTSLVKTIYAKLAASTNPDGTYHITSGFSSSLPGSTISPNNSFYNSSTVSAITWYYNQENPEVSNDSYCTITIYTTSSVNSGWTTVKFNRGGTDVLSLNRSQFTFSSGSWTYTVYGSGEQTITNPFYNNVNTIVTFT